MPLCQEGKDCRENEQSHKLFALFGEYTELLDGALTCFAASCKMSPGDVAEELRFAQERGDNDENEEVIQAILGAVEYPSFVRLMSREVAACQQARIDAADMGF